MSTDSKKQREYVQMLEQAIANLENQSELSNDQIKGLFKTFLMVQIENSKFVDEMSDVINKQGKEIKDLTSKIS